ncbi:MAG TPA: metal ABC transporter permease [Actinomycetes bacterium]|nr:metal ABC transporter permease [Actinomycetes bacterium]
MSGPAGLLAPAFMQRALVEAVLVGALCGVVGVHVLLRRLPFFAMAMGHATFPGVVLASIAGIDLLLGAGLFGLAVVLAVALFGSTRRVDPTSATGVVLAGAFALGVLLVSTRSGFSRDLAAYLTGSIVTVRPGDLVVTAAVAAAVLAALAALHKELLLGAFDPTTLAALGYPAVALDVAFLVLLELVVVACVPAVGTILPVALLTAPAAAARLWTDRLGVSMAVGGALGAASGAAGLLLSAAWRIAAGPAIVLVAAAAFAASLLLAPGHGARRLARRAAARSATAVS